jgi:hypothetical protein
MSFFSTSANIRVLLLTVQGISAFIWQKDALLPVGRFTATEADDDAFNSYLSVAPETPLYLVVDVLEEDFRLENVPHVQGRERRALLERKLGQFFRNTEYRAALVQGREEKGRRDDQVLFCALTNTEQIGYWVRRILARKAPLQGILSVPWLLESLVGTQRLDQLPHLLLVNIEQDGNLRQTYLQAGSLKFSRLASLVSVRLGNLAETIVAECGHTRQYLERLRLLPRDQPLDIHLMTQGEIGEEIESGLADSPLFSFHLHETGVVAAELGFDPDLEDGQGLVFVALMQALRSRKGLFNIYGSASDTRYSRLYKLRRGLIAGTSLFFAAVLAAGFFLLADGFKLQVEKDRLERETQLSSRHYQKLLQALPQTPVPAEAMRNVVDSFGAIQQQTAFPVEMMMLVSRALAACPDIHLHKFDWKLASQNQGGTGGEVASLSSAGATQSAGGEAGEQKAASALLHGMLAGKAQVSALLAGSIFPADGYLSAQQSVTRFITSLEQVPGLKASKVVMPTETSPDNSLRATLDGKEIKTGFSLQLVYQLRQNK